MRRTAIDPNHGRVREAVEDTVILTSECRTATTDPVSRATTRP